MEISGTVEPGLLDLIRYVDHERVAFPAANRPAHPRIRRSLWLAIHENRARRIRIFIRDQDLFRSLNNPKRERHIRGAGYPRQIALRFRVTHRLVGL